MSLYPAVQVPGGVGSAAAPPEPALPLPRGYLSPPPKWLPPAPAHRILALQVQAEHQGPAGAAL